MEYEVVAEEVELDGVYHTVYGIAYTDEHFDRHLISDITTDFDEISELVCDFNLFHPDAVHIYDIIEDFCFQNC